MENPEDRFSRDEAQIKADKTFEAVCLMHLLIDKTQTGLLSYRDYTEPWNFGYSKYR